MTNPADYPTPPKTIFNKCKHCGELILQVDYLGSLTWVHTETRDSDCYLSAEPEAE